MAVVTKAVPASRFDSVTLELTGEEAEFLAAVTRKISGDPRWSRRRLADSIEKSLQNAGVPNDVSDVECGMSFRNKSVE